MPKMQINKIYCEDCRGTTAKMAHLQNRNWIGSELSQDYVDLAYKRLEPYLAQTKLL